MLLQAICLLGKLPLCFSVSLSHKSYCIIFMISLVGFAQLGFRCSKIFVTKRQTNTEVTFLTNIYHNGFWLNNIWHVLSSYRMLSKFLVRFSKWLQNVKKGVIDLFLCIAMAYNVFPCTEIIRNTQTEKIADFTM